MTTDRIKQEYINATAEQWESFVKESEKLWSTMKSDIHVPSKGVDIFSARVDAFWRRFKAETEKQWQEYLAALEAESNKHFNNEE